METNQTAPEAGPAPADAKGDSAHAVPPAEGAVGSASSPAADASGPGLSAWLRGLGLPRRAGWLGGVCAGIAARIGIDPVIVRGIVVVVAVLGAPLVLLYAIAWLLLPDTEGEIHFERLMRGIVDPAIVGIAVMGAIGLVPLVQGGWLGWRWWPDWPEVWVAGFDVMWPLRVLWVLVVVGAIVALVIWLARRAASQNAPAGAAPRMASASTAGPGHPFERADAAADPAATPSAPTATAEATTGTATTSAIPMPPPPTPVGASGPGTEPLPPAEGADAAAIAEWRAHHEAWRVSHADWRAGQAEAERAARARAAEENKAKARALAAEADAARVARRASRPRASAALVFTVLGVALVAGGVAAILSLGDVDAAGFAIPIALAVTTITIAAGMIIAALLRRRSGALAFLGVLATSSMFIAVIAAAIVPQGSLVPPGSGLDLTVSQRVVQPFGDAYLVAPATGASSPAVVELTQGTGSTFLTVLEDARVVLDATEAGPVEVWVFSPDGNAARSGFGSIDGRVVMLGGETPVTDEIDGPADTRLVLKQGSGRVYIDIREGDRP